MVPYVCLINYCNSAQLCYVILILYNFMLIALKLFSRALHEDNKETREI
jgi:hypothetical protein